MSDNSRYSGMTTNERLAEACLIDAFDRARVAEDRAQMAELLMWVEFSQADAEKIADLILAYPEVYGVASKPPAKHSARYNNLSDRVRKQNGSTDDAQGDW